MAFPKTRFNTGTPFVGQQENRVEIIMPSKGINVNTPASLLEPGESPEANNFEADHGFLRPRSGLSQFGDSVTGVFGVNPGLLAYEHQSVAGELFPVAASARTIAVFGIGAASWSTLSYVVRSSGFSADALSGSTSDGIFAASVYEPASDQNWLVLTNGVNTPKQWTPSLTTYSDISDFISVESRAKYVFALDNRLCFWHCASSQTTFATRLRYSERGLSSQFSTVGAGFIDVMDMRGEGTGALAREHDGLLFSTDEIWVARPRRDFFAFDTLPLSRGIGTRWPKTIANTPIGVIFLARDFDFYVVQGGNVNNLGAKVHPKVRDEIRNADFAHALYNGQKQRYEFYYMVSSDVNRPSRALFYDLRTQGWLPQQLPFEVSAGVETAESVSDDFDLIDELTGTIDDQNVNIDDYFTPGSKGQARDVMLISSNGTAVRFLDEQTTDLGSRITHTWDSHAMSWPEDSTRRQSLTEMWLDYEADVASNVSIFTRGVPNDAYGDAVNVTLATADDGATQGPISVWANGHHPQFRVQVVDGSRPLLGRFTAKIKSAGRY